MAQRKLEQSEIQKGSFVWETANFLNETEYCSKSPMFQFGRFTCCLCVPKCFNGYSINDVRQIDLMTVNFPVNGSMFGEKTAYTLSLINRFGEEFLTTKGTIRRENKIVIMVLFVDYLKKYQNEFVSDKRTVTFRLSWNPWKEASVRNQGIQTLPDLKAEEEPSSLLETLSNDFKCLYESQLDTDCVLRVGETQFPVHRTVLSARSTVFSAMFRHDTSERRTGEVDISDVEATFMGNVLHYVYTSKICGLNENTAAPMYTLADKYALIELRDICRQFLMHNLTTDNVCDVAVLAHLHAEAELEERVVKFIERRLDDFEESDKWIQFSKSKPLLALKLVRLALKASKSEKK